MNQSLSKKQNCLSCPHPQFVPKLHQKTPSRLYTVIRYVHRPCPRLNSAESTRHSSGSLFFKHLHMCYNDPYLQVCRQILLLYDKSLATLLSYFDHQTVLFCLYKTQIRQYDRSYFTFLLSKSCSSN